MSSDNSGRIQGAGKPLTIAIATILASGQATEVRAQAALDEVLVTARKHGKDVFYKAKHVIGADGPSSLVTRASSAVPRST